MSKRYAAILIALAVAVVMMFVARERKRFFTNTGVVWTTEYHITYEAARDLGDSIQQIFNQIDLSVSPYNKVSLVTSLNGNATDQVDAYVKRLLVASREVNQASGGAFDPTVMPLVNAWGFGYKNGTMPTQVQIDSILHFVGLDKLRLEGNTLVKADPRVMLDFSSIAKGMACDEIGRMLVRNGVTNWLVEIGGEVVASGLNKRGTSWTVAVDMPNEEGNDNETTHESALTLALDNEAVATSGNYRKWREESGNKISHIIDPRTGESRVGTLLSVTVVAHDCMTADAWATACMVMGESEVKRMMQPRDDLGVMTISADTVSGNFIVWSNKAFAERVQTTTTE